MDDVVCAPPAGAQTLAPPMQSILSRLKHYDHVKIVVFSDDTILNKPVDQWPICDCLVAFFSKGFPLQKATAYVSLRKPFVFNDLSIQYTLQDRSLVLHQYNYVYTECTECLAQYIIEVYIHVQCHAFVMGMKYRTSTF